MNSWVLQTYCMKLRHIYESQYKDPSTFMDRTQIGTQYAATDINDTMHHPTAAKPKNKRQIALQRMDDAVKKRLGKS